MAEGFSNFSLVQALLNRRSRRVGLGMSIPAGPLRYTSPHKPISLTEAEEAALAFAACGITGYALADLSYGAGEGGSMLAGRLDCLRSTIGSHERFCFWKPAQRGIVVSLRYPSLG